MTDAFESPHLLIEGARKDVAELDAQFKAFVAKLKPESVVRHDSRTGEKVAKLYYAQKMPGTLRVLASNALNNLRHSLDQAVNCAAVELGGNDHNYFPFAQNAADMDNALKDRCKTVPVALHPTLKAFKPYPGGDDLLNALRVANKNKHRSILKLDATPVGVRYQITRGIVSGSGSFGDFRWDSNKQELEVARVSNDGHLDLQGKSQATFRILLRDTPTPSGEPAPAVLYALANKAESVLLTLEAETARLRGI